MCFTRSSARAELVRPDHAVRIYHAIARGSAGLRFDTDKPFDGGELMHPYPHTYVASAAGENAGLVAVGSQQAPVLETAPPPQFDGPGGVWSPETLLCASLADCFILTFRAVARAARFEWLHLECRVEGLLERVERSSQFTRFTTFAKLTVPTGAELVKARELLERAEHGCLIANSLRGSRALEPQVVVAERQEAG